MRWLIAALALVLAAATAYAQTSPQQMNMNAAQRLGNSAGKNGGDDAAGSKAKANDKAYNAALKNLPDKQYDPWHGVR
jgi:hypothetical protein